MGFAEIVRSGIAIANTLTETLQVTVSLVRWTGQANTGVPTYAAGLDVEALVEPDKRAVRRADGTEQFLLSRITILSPLTAQGSTGRDEPIDARDKVVLPDGTTCPIYRIDGALTDPSTNLPYMFKLTLVQ